MNFVSPFLKRVLYPALHQSGQLSHFADSGPLAIVTYHGVLPALYPVRDLRLDGGWVTAKAFQDQLRFLRQRYNLVTPEQVSLWISGQGDLPPRAVLLTCDDGLSNAVSEMLPILQSENATCLFFVTADSLLSEPAMLWYEELYLCLLAAPEGAFTVHFNGTEFSGVLKPSVAQRHAVWRQLVEQLSAGDELTRRDSVRILRAQVRLPDHWFEQYSPYFASRFRLLSSAEIVTLLGAGMSIGSHTVTHPKLSRLPKDLAWKEISESRYLLERAFDIKVWAIAYPFGGSDSVSERELAMAEAAGYSCAFVNFGGGFGGESPRFALRRVHLTNEMSLAEFEGHLSGLHERLRRWMGYSETVACNPETKLAGDRANLNSGQ